MKSAVMYLWNPREYLARRGDLAVPPSPDGWQPSQRFLVDCITRVLVQAANVSRRISEKFYQSADSIESLDPLDEPTLCFCRRTIKSASEMAMMIGCKEEKAIETLIEAQWSRRVDDFNDMPDANFNEFAEEIYSLELTTGEMRYDFKRFETLLGLYATAELLGMQTLVLSFMMKRGLLPECAEGETESRKMVVPFRRLRKKYVHLRRTRRCDDVEEPLIIDSLITKVSSVLFCMDYGREVDNIPGELRGRFLLSINRA